MQESAESFKCLEQYQMDELKKPAKKRENKPADKCLAYFDTYNECMKLAVSRVISSPRISPSQNEERRKKNASRGLFG